MNETLMKLKKLLHENSIDAFYDRYVKCLFVYRLIGEVVVGFKIVNHDNKYELFVSGRPLMSKEERESGCRVLLSREEVLNRMQYCVRNKTRTYKNEEVSLYD